MGNTEKTRSEEACREELQTLFDRSFSEGGGKELRERYRSLRALERKYAKSQPTESVDVSRLAENVTAASDIAVTGTGKSFIFCGNNTSPVRGNGRLITTALLSLLSNAFLYGKGSLVTVKTVETEKFVKLEVKSGGGFCFRSIKKDGGLSRAREICRQANGRLFIESDTVSSSVAAVFEKSSETPADCPDLFELLEDRLSPVYVEFFGL